MPLSHLPRLIPRLMPRRTVRLRLTLLYGTLFIASGTVLLAITYLLVQHSAGPLVLYLNGTPRQLKPPTGNGGLPTTGVPQLVQNYAEQVREQAIRQHAFQMHQLLIQSGVALSIMMVVSIALGWVVAGRVLRPLRTMTATVQRISARNVHERLAAQGPRDELKHLADTVDGLLSRLETALDAHKRFVANAAHELRTPLTLEHALLEELLTDQHATIESFRATANRVLAISEQQAHLLEALLTLAGSESGLDRRDPIDLAVLADRALQAARTDISRQGLQVRTDTASAPTVGAPALVERLLANLIDNAVSYNVEGGRVELMTTTTGGSAVVSVANTGPVIPPSQVNRLFEPFQRLGHRTAQNDRHHGLGLSIVRAIATAHDATLSTHTPPEGGLVVRIGFPLPDTKP